VNALRLVVEIVAHGLNLLLVEAATVGSPDCEKRELGGQHGAIRPEVRKSTSD
jgi:hypothetical protein